MLVGLNTIKFENKNSFKKLLIYKNKRNFNDFEWSWSKLEIKFRFYSGYIYTLKIK